MTATIEGTPDVPGSWFQVTQFIRPAQAGTGWSQSATGELDSAAAIRWIQERAREAADLGFADGDTPPPAIPQPAFYAADKVTPAGPAPASDQPGLAPGNA